ncbi:serine/threonine protein kinase [Xenococcus sp. PCC 7305]|uniref:protein kinase domain-containing protein n=1 Tax=Xenococcus sp. PCC 7305 TaxID=102125 RepID=UPI0002ACFCB8|nr:protein kinase [Xenococcus sp. PCC 7305]ELS04381.1 serine/threonine protein kinase [Xenococcus sp. PCC 7305]
MDFSKQENNPQSREIIESFARGVLQNKYHLIKKLYEEEIETVYVATTKDTSSSAQYLIQQFTPQYVSEAQLIAAKRLFNQEAAILQRLGHHGQIPSIHDYFETQGQFFVVQEFIVGQSFQDELGEANAYSQQETIEFLNNILPVLNFIHDNNYIHRDIKPSHLMRNSADQKIALINFYSIKEKINPQNLDITGQFAPHLTVGTQGYIPMEQHLGKPVFCSDIYALGIVVIQALTKIKLIQLKYDDNNNPVWRHLLPNVSAFDPEFLDIIDAMVCCNYQKRYQSAIAILESLKKLTSAHKFSQATLVTESSAARVYSSERTLVQSNRESTPQGVEHTVIQQSPESNIQSPEQTQIINNSETAPSSSERTLIIGNSEAPPKATEHTLIIQSHDHIESTRIIEPGTVGPRNKHKNQKDEAQLSLKLMAIISTALIASTMMLGLLILRNNQNSRPENSSKNYPLAIKN